MYDNGTGRRRRVWRKRRSRAQAPRLPTEAGKSMYKCQKECISMYTYVGFLVKDVRAHGAASVRAHAPLTMPLNRCRRTVPKDSPTLQPSWAGAAFPPVPCPHWL